MARSVSCYAPHNVSHYAPRNIVPRNVLRYKRTAFLKSCYGSQRIKKLKRRIKVDFIIDLYSTRVASWGPKGIPEGPKGIPEGPKGIPEGNPLKVLTVCF